MEVDDGEEAGEMVREVLKKLQEQGQLIKLLQAQVDFQNDRSTKQEGVILDLTDKVNELTKKISGGAEGTASPEDDAGGIWKETKNLSLADAVKETAELTLMTNAGFVFDKASGLYCNYSTGYYYDPAQELYYNGHTGVYYTYNADTQKYIFHSQVQLPTADNTNKTEKSKKKISNKPVKSKSKNNADSSEMRGQNMRMSPDDRVEASRRVLPKKQEKTVKKLKTTLAKAVENPEDVEEGELSDSSTESDHQEEMGDDDVSEIASGSEDDMKSEGADIDEYPPCIRAIVLETSSEDIKKGSLFLVTCMGGTIGREGTNHAILLPDPQVNKAHAKIQYMPDPNITESKSDKYYIVDEGSRTGTVLNGTRLSEEKIVSHPHEILHGSILKIGGFSILLHIHPGSFTCGHCEPGLLIEPDQVNGSSATTSMEKGKSRNAMMRQIKRKYGINGPKQVHDSTENYTDRAQERRVTKGSDNPYEKTQVATIDESIGKTNKGFKMLAKMGWSAGKSLGQTGDQGLLEPIKLELKSDRGGLGLNPSPGDVLGNASSGLKKSKHATSKSKQKQNRMDQLAITMKRFKEAEASVGFGPGGPKMDGDNNEASS